MELKEGLRVFLEAIKQNRNYRDLLNSAFELSFRFQEENVESCLMSVISEMFKVNSTILVDYLCSPDNFTSDDLNLADNGLMNFINELKLKYGFFIRTSRDRTRNPFGIKEIQGTVGQGLSHNTLRITRFDEESITLSCNAQDLVHLLNSVNGMLLNTISVGVYNLNLDTINLLLNQGKELNSKIEAIINASNK